MINFKEMYLHLFNSVTDAIMNLDHGDSDRAKHILVSAQAECEEIYIQVNNKHSGNKQG